MRLRTELAASEPNDKTYILDLARGSPQGGVKSKNHKPHKWLSRGLNRVDISRSDLFFRHFPLCRGKKLSPPKV